MKVFKVFSILSIALFAASTIQAQTVEDYKAQRAHLVTGERFIFARQTVKQATTPAVINEAVQDLLKHSDHPDEYTGALEIIRSNLHKLESDSLPYEEARLAEAKFLSRLGQRSEAEAIFQNAIENEWQHALWRYSENFIDMGELDRASILEFKRVTDHEAYSAYRSKEDDLTIFITLLRMMTHDDPDAFAAARVGEWLDEISEMPQMIKSAQALCLAEDERFPEALNHLAEVESAVSKDENPTLWRDLPLYHASVLFCEGTRIEEAHQALNQYLQRIDGDYQKLLQKCLRLTRDLEIHLEDKRKIHHVTRYLLESPIITDSETNEQFSDNDIAQIYDMHQQGLAFDGRLDESAEICQFVMDNYYPETLAGANCAMNYARYIGATGQPEKAAEIFRDILQRAPFDEIIPWVKFSLAEYHHNKGENSQALLLISEVLNLVKEHDRGSVKRGREAALELQRKILSARGNN